jgi:hypothetical protein
VETARLLWRGVAFLATLAAVLALPAANYFVWKSELKPNLKLVYVSVTSLLLIGIMMIVEYKKDAVVDDLYRRFDPDLTFYDKDIFKPSKLTFEQTANHEMGLDTCIDPEGNLVDLKKRFRLDQSWVLVEIPDEYMRRDSVTSVMKKGGIKSNSLAQSSKSYREQRANQIKLEDFRFLDIYLKKERIKYAGVRADGILFFDLDGVTEDSFERYVRTVEEYQKGSLFNLNVLFTTADNFLTNKLKSTRR